ncbi:MAG: aminotransferase class III-fold pyridoxal phosphate-dependent enzyme, partial [Chroococcales cyanobacterium]
ASTYGGNPFACGVALTVCQTLEQENLLANAAQRGEQLRQGLQAIATEYPNLIAEVRGWGLINGLELSAETEMTSIEIVKVAMAEGLLLVPAGPKVVRFVPPLIVTPSEIDEALATLGKAIAQLSA